MALHNVVITLSVCIDIHDEDLSIEECVQNLDYSDIAANDFCAATVRSVEMTHYDVAYSTTGSEDTEESVEVD